VPLDAGRATELGSIVHRPSLGVMGTGVDFNDSESSMPYLGGSAQGSSDSSRNAWRGFMHKRRPERFEEQPGTQAASTVSISI
jgi:hypothetical protein